MVPWPQPPPPMLGCPAGDTGPLAAQHTWPGSVKTSGGIQTTAHTNWDLEGQGMDSTGVGLKDRAVQTASLS